MFKEAQKLFVEGKNNQGETVDLIVSFKSYLPEHYIAYEIDNLGCKIKQDCVIIYNNEEIIIDSRILNIIH